MDKLQREKKLPPTWTLYVVSKDKSQMQYNQDKNTNTDEV